MFILTCCSIHSNARPAPNPRVPRASSDSFTDGIRNCTLPGTALDNDAIADCVRLILSSNGYTCPDCKKVEEDELVKMYHKSTPDFNLRQFILAKITVPVNETSTLSVQVGIANSVGVTVVRNPQCISGTVAHCNWTYALTDVGDRFFPRYLLLPECHGCRGNDEACLNEHNQCSVKEAKTGSVSLLKRQQNCQEDGTEQWEPQPYPGPLTLGCSCAQRIDYG